MSTGAGFQPSTVVVHKFPSGKWKETLLRYCGNVSHDKTLFQGYDMYVIFT